MGSLMEPKGKSQVTFLSLSLSLPLSPRDPALVSLLLSAGLSHVPLCLIAGFISLMVVSLLSENSDLHVLRLSLSHITNFISSSCDFSAQIPTTD